MVLLPSRGTNWVSRADLMSLNKPIRVDVGLILFTLP